MSGPETPLQREVRESIEWWDSRHDPDEAGWWNPRHDSEQVIGRIPVYHYRDELPPPILRDTTPDPSALAEVLEIVFGVIVIGLCIAGLIMWAAIASVATP